LIALPGVGDQGGDPMLERGGARREKPLMHRIRRFFYGKGGWRPRSPNI